MTNKISKINLIGLLSNKIITDGGQIYFLKQLKVINQSNNFTIIYIENLNLFYKKIISFLSNKYFNFFFRIPFLSIIQLLLFKVIARIVLKNVTLYLNNKNCNKVIIPTGDILCFEIGILLKKKKLITHLHYTVLDLPWTYKNSYINNFIIKRYILRKIMHFSSADFISEKMYSIFKHKFSHSNSIITNALVDLLITNEEIFESKTKKGNIKHLVHLSFAGNFRFKKEIISFIDLLESNKINFQFHFFSSNKIENSNIINHGFINSRKDLLIRLNEMDVGFIPMSFSEKDKELVETSFPSKLATYLTAGIPVVVFAPKFSAVSEFVKKYKLGLVISDKNLIKCNLTNEINDINIHFHENIYLIKNKTEEAYQNLTNILTEN